MADSNRYRFGPLEAEHADILIELALAEDLDDQGDLTAEALIDPSAQGTAWFRSRSPGVLCGLPIVRRLADRFALNIEAEAGRTDGHRLAPGESIARVQGAVRSILAFERTALNFLQRLSGIATLTDRFVQAVAGTSAAILDTRKTTPGWRALEKYAVRCGGGQNHRIGLYDAILIKDNHLAWLADTPDPISQAIAQARAFAPPGTIIEIEVDDFEQFDRALSGQPDIILLDNFAKDDLSEAVRRRNQQALNTVRLEASGGIGLQAVAEIAQTGVDRISVGALTHSAPALDIGLDDDHPRAI